MCDVMEDMDNDATIDAVKQKVVALCKRFPVYEAG
jgi:glycine hydroxymethyltransferase